MKNISFFILVLSSLTLCFLSCKNTPQKRVPIENKEVLTLSNPLNPLNDFIGKEYEKSPTLSMTDPRDGEIYKTIQIGDQIWMAENLRYKNKGSMVIPNVPSESYGRLYNVYAAQTACPAGWHLPSDAEWDKVEMAHGMPATFIGKGGWRGEHGTLMKSTEDWQEDGNGTNDLGFNIIPAGYYFGESSGMDIPGFDGLGFSAGYWSSMVDNITFARFLFSSRKWINKWEDKNNDSAAALSCRCVQDQ